MGRDLLQRTHSSISPVASAGETVDEEPYEHDPNDGQREPGAEQVPPPVRILLEEAVLRLDGGLVQLLPAGIRRQRRLAALVRVRRLPG
jgi:hypothetical protein